MYQQVILALAVATVAVACPDHDFGSHQNSLTRRATGVKDWAYDASYNWGALTLVSYTLCQTGTQQAPIALKSADAFATTHNPIFNYTTPLAGSLFNWNYGPSFSVDTNITALTNSASLTFDEETVYLKGWHIHSPADHSIDGIKARSELHLVHGDVTGKERAVLAIPINPGVTDSPFVAQFIRAINCTSSDSTQLPNFDSADAVSVASLDVSLAIQEAGDFAKYWTYNGGLTSPPCTEGIRFFVSGTVLTVGLEQMQEILRVSRYSARAEQNVWRHDVNV